MVQIFSNRLVLAVLILVIIGGTIFVVVKSNQPTSVCGGIPQETNWENEKFWGGRPIRATAAAGDDKLWVGFGDGGIGLLSYSNGKYFLEECAGPAQKSGFTVNDIEVLP